MTPKVFCVGFHKTGTSSLAVALKKLGYRVVGASGRHDPDIADNVLPMAYELVETYDAFQDNPWPIIYKELDAKYPGSKFIMTMRSPESWIKSQVKHFGHKETPMRTWIYGVGCPEGNEAIYLKRYNDHNKEVVEYFKDRPNDFLIMDFSNGDGWEKLCPFLGCDIPSRDFPHANKAQTRKWKILRRRSRKYRRLIIGRSEK